MLAQPIQTEQILAGKRLLLFCAGALGMLMLQHSAPAPLLALLAFAAIAIAIWHGAFDMVLAEEMLPSRGIAWQLWFAGTYMAAAIAVGVLWWLLPVFALAAFLVYSAWHFGTESLERMSAVRALPSFCYGAIPIAAACHWHSEQVVPIFATMLRMHAAPGPAARIAAYAGAALWPLAGVSALGLLARPRLPWFWWPALATGLLLFRFGAPLLAFAVYFCLWHTPEHLISSSRTPRGCFSPVLLRRRLWHGLVPWLASLVGLIGLCLAFRGRLLQDEALLFILLSALTVPHMLLNEVRRLRPLPSTGGGR